MTEKIKQCKKWHNDNRGLYESCGETVKRLIGILLDKKGVSYHSIDYRIKTEKSFLDKCENEKYDDPISQITDMCGLRIISYTNHDVAMIQRIIEEEFEIDRENSINKSETLNEDQVGYLSVHYVASLKAERTELAEYQVYSGIKFEIQIRTLLQHAWAEIEHDRNYKFSGALPREIKRRFYLVAGTLELLDREFEQISKDIDEYANDVREATQKGDLDVLIDSTSLMEYLITKFKDYPDIEKSFNGRDKKIVIELQGFGVNTLEDLDEIINKTNIDLNKLGKNYLGVLRSIMIVADPDKYFDEVWNHNWRGMQRDRFNYLSSLNPNCKKHESKLYLSE